MNEISVIKKYKKLRTFIKVLPFIYVVLYLIGMLVYIFCSEMLISLVDMLFYLSPLTMVLNMILGRFCDLCKWHRLACFTPIIGFLSVMVDCYVYSLERIYTIVSIYTFAFIFIISLLSAYMMFLKNKSI